MIVVDFMLSQEETMQAAWVNIHLFDGLILKDILI